MIHQNLRTTVLSAALCSIIVLSGCASSEQSSGDSPSWAFWNSTSETQQVSSQGSDGSVTIAGESIKDDMQASSTTLTVDSSDDSQVQAKECPDVAVLEELNSLYEFTSFNSPTPDNSISTVWITGLDIKCKVTSENTELFIDLIFESHLGPKAEVLDGQNTVVKAPYFVALTDSRGNIVAKKVHSVDMSFKSRDDYIIDKQTITQKLSKEKILSYGGVEVLIGFQLTEEQLNYNRQAKINSNAFQ